MLCQRRGELVSSVNGWPTTGRSRTNWLGHVGTDFSKFTQRQSYQVLRLLYAIDKLTLTPGYSRAIKKHSSECQRLKEELRVYVAISQASIVLFEHLQPLEGPAGDDAKKQAKERYLEISDKQARSIATLLARLLLAAEGARTRIANRLTTIGLEVPEIRPLPLPIGPWCSLVQLSWRSSLSSRPFSPSPSPYPRPCPISW